MRNAPVAASLLLAVFVLTPNLVSPSFAASDNPVASTAPAPAKRKVVQPLKPTWEQCFDMSINRGFNRDIEEWHQSIDDCMSGKIPL